jgi:hypothetical protein
MLMMMLICLLLALNDAPATATARSTVCSVSRDLQIHTRGAALIRSPGISGIWFRAHTHSAMTEATVPFERSDTVLYRTPHSFALLLFKMKVSFSPIEGSIDYCTSEVTMLLGVDRS